ncbi:MAG: hypothetical protein ACLTDX_10815 [[Clostridium] innocuum]
MESSVQEGVSFAETACHLRKGQFTGNTDVQTLGGQLNTPYLLKGRLPENEKEIAVSKTYADDSGKTIGDTIRFHEPSQIELALMYHICHRAGPSGFEQ